MNLYRNESSNPKWNAQRNLNGRTHYVDDDTLRFYKSRILYCHITENGLLLALVESCAADPENRKRVYRPVVFDVFGHVIHKPDFEHSFSKSKKAHAAMWDALNTIDAKAHTLKAINEQEKSYLSETASMRAKLSAF